MNTRTYAAPWGKTLRWTSALSTALLVGLCVLLSFMKHTAGAWYFICLPPMLILGAAFFVVRSYTLQLGELLVRRAFWTTRLPLTGLRSAQFQPDAMRASIRVFGNGGMFSFTGWFRNSELGAYRALVTDLNRTVVLRFDKKTLVVSPDEPERFAAEIKSFT